MSIECPSFFDLFDLWVKEKWQGYVLVLAWERDIDVYDIILRVPNDIYTKFNHVVAGTMQGLDVSLVLRTNQKHFNVNDKYYKQGRLDTRHASDPNFFQWFSETLKRENFDEMSRIEKIL